jgi:hypothetical protein
MIVVTGNPVPIEKLEEVDIGPSGMSYTIGIEGVKLFVEEMLGFYAMHATDIAYRANGATAKITARYAGPAPGVTEVPLDTISLKTSEIQQALYKNARYASLHPGTIDVIRRAVLSDEEYSDKLDKIYASANAHGTSGPLAQELFDWLLAGTDSYQVCVRTITRTRTVSQRFDRKVAQADMDKLFTPEQLATYLGSGIPFTVPTLTLNAAEIALGLIVAWRKFMCDCDDTAGGQGQLVEAWQLAKWSPHYDLKA